MGSCWDLHKSGCAHAFFRRHKTSITNKRHFSSRKYLHSLPAEKNKTFDNS